MWVFRGHLKNAAGCGVEELQTNFKFWLTSETWTNGHKGAPVIPNRHAASCRLHLYGISGAAAHKVFVMPCDRASSF